MNNWSMEGTMIKVLAATLISLSLFAPVASQAQRSPAQADALPPASAQDSDSINITRSGSQQPIRGPAEHFTGSVQVEPLFLCTIHRAQAVGRSHSHPARGAHGIRPARANLDRDG